MSAVAKSSDANDGCLGVLGAGIIGVIVAIAMLPKVVWIIAGAIIAAGLLTWLCVIVANAVDAQYVDAKKRTAAKQSTTADAAKRAREEKARREKRQRIKTLGEKNAAQLEAAQAAVQRVARSEAARSGWLGDIDFSADIHSITEGFGKAFALRKVADELATLDDPNDDDRRLLAEAQVTMDTLQGRAAERVALIRQCATEAGLIDESLRKEREDARTAEQRARLHGKLSALLYGIEAAPDIAVAESGADRVMSRVGAYQQIKKQILLARDREGE